MNTQYEELEYITLYEDMKRNERFAQAAFRAYQTALEEIAELYLKLEQIEEPEEEKPLNPIATFILILLMTAGTAGFGYLIYAAFLWLGL